MKLSIAAALLLVAFVAVVRGDSRGEFQRIAKQCMAEQHVSETEMREFSNNGMKPADAKESLKCTMKCIMEKQGQMQGGNFNEEGAVRSLKNMVDSGAQNEDLEKAVKECKNEKGINDCDTAYKIGVCLKFLLDLYKQV